MNSYINTAIAYHKSGEFDKAADFYQQGLQKEPQAHVHYLLGTVLLELGNFDEAGSHAELALFEDPSKTSYLQLMGQIRQAQARYAEAIQYYQLSQQEDPDHSATILGLQICSMQLEIANEEYNEAVIRYNHCLESDIHSDAISILLLRALAGQKRWSDIRAQGEHLYQQHIHNADMLYCLGACYLHEPGQIQEGLALLHRTLCLDPLHLACLHLLAEHYFQEAQYEHAVDCIDRIEAQDIWRSSIVLLKANTLSKWKNSQALITYLEEHLHRFPQNDDILCALSHHHFLIASVEKDYSLEKAFDYAEQALEVGSENPQPHFNISNLYSEIAQPHLAYPYYRRGLEINGYNPGAHATSLFNGLYSYELSPQEMHQHRLEWSEKYELPLLKEHPNHQHRKDSQKTLRIAYLSADLCLHPVGYFLQSFFAEHAKHNIEIYCYANHDKFDELTRLFSEHSTQWLQVKNLSDEELSAQIQSDQIDILVDLAGHSFGNRLHVFARKPAPVQVSWLGFAASTGLQSIDYRFSDAITEPPGLADSLSSEKIYRLPHGFHCYGPQYNFPEVSPTPALKNGYITFGSFNNLSKVSPPTLRTWARILQKVNKSRILLKGRHLRCRETRQHVYSYFDEQNISRDRVIIGEFTSSNIAHLELYASMDIALDPFPYNGTTTTCEALYMGVPVIALTGDTHVSRVTTSLLHQVRMADWCAQSTEEYIDLAAKKAKDIGQLATIRLNLNQRMRGSSLCNAPQFAQELFDAYQTIWQEWCST